MTAIVIKACVCGSWLSATKRNHINSQISNYGSFAHQFQTAQQICQKDSGGQACGPGTQNNCFEERKFVGCMKCCVAPQYVWQTENLLNDQAMKMAVGKCYLKEQVSPEEHKINFSNLPCNIKNYYAKIYECAMAKPPVDSAFAQDWLMFFKKQNEERKDCPEEHKHVQKKTQEEQKWDSQLRYQYDKCYKQEVPDSHKYACTDNPNCLIYFHGKISNCVMKDHTTLYNKGYPPRENYARRWLGDKYEEAKQDVLASSVIDMKSAADDSARAAISVKAKVAKVKELLDEARDKARTI